MCTIMQDQRHLRTPMSVVTIVVTIYVLQGDAVSGKFTLNRPEAPPEGLRHAESTHQIQLPI